MAGNFIEQLKRRQDAGRPAPEAAPEAPEPEDRPSFADPEVRAEYLGDELRDARQELERERKARQQAERRLEVEAQTQPSSLAEVLHAKQRGKHRTWR